MRSSNRTRVCILFLFLISTNSSNGEAPIRTIDDLLRSVAIARDSLFQYAVTLEVEGKLQTLAECFPQLCESEKFSLSLEYSRIGQHFSTIANCGPSKRGFIGRSDDLVFEGDADGLFVDNCGTFGFGFRHRNELVVFDPRAVGLLDLEQLSRGISYESAMSVLLRAPVESADLWLSDGLWRVNWPASGLSIAFDAEKDFWPTRYERVYPDRKQRDFWSINLRKFQSRHLPSSADFYTERIVNDKVEREHKLSLRFSWTRVNSHLSTGVKGVQRIADVNNVSVLNQP